MITCEEIDIMSEMQQAKRSKSVTPEIMNNLTSETSMEKYNSSTSDDKVGIHSVSETSCLCEFDKRFLNSSAIKLLGLNDKHADDDEILNEISIHIDHLNNIDIISRWGLINYQRFSMLTLLNFQRFYGTSKKFMNIKFLPPHDVIQQIKLRNLLDDSMVITLISTSILQDDFNVLSWLLENNDVMRLLNTVRTNRSVTTHTNAYGGIVTMQSRGSLHTNELNGFICKKYLEKYTSNIHEDKFKLYVYFTITLWDSIFEYYTNIIKLNPINRAKLLTDTYKSTVRRIQKYKDVISDLQSDATRMSTSLSDNFLNVMFIFGDATDRESELLKYLHTLDSRHLSKCYLERNYPAMFSPILELQEFKLIKSFAGLDHVLFSYVDRNPLINIFDILLAMESLNYVFPDFKLSRIKAKKVKLYNLRTALIHEIGDDGFELLVNFLTDPMAILDDLPLRHALTSSGIHKEVALAFRLNFRCKLLNGEVSIYKN